MVRVQGGTERDDGTNGGCVSAKIDWRKIGSSQGGSDGISSGVQVVPDGSGSCDCMRWRHSSLLASGKNRREGEVAEAAEY